MNGRIYIFCGPFEYIKLADLVKRNLPSEHRPIISSHAECFRGLSKQTIYYTKRVEEDAKEYSYMHLIAKWGNHTLLPFPFEQVTKLGRLLRGVE